MSITLDILLHCYERINKDSIAINRNIDFNDSSIANIINHLLQDKLLSVNNKNDVAYKLTKKGMLVMSMMLLEYID